MTSDGRTARGAVKGPELALREARPWRRRAGARRDAWRRTLIRPVGQPADSSDADHPDPARPDPVQSDSDRVHRDADRAIRRKGRPPPGGRAGVVTSTRLGGEEPGRGCTVANDP